MYGDLVAYQGSGDKARCLPAVVLQEDTLHFQYHACHQPGKLPLHKAHSSVGDDSKLEDSSCLDTLCTAKVTTVTRTMLGLFVLNNYSTWVEEACWATSQHMDKMVEADLCPLNHWLHTDWRRTHNRQLAACCGNGNVPERIMPQVMMMLMSNKNFHTKQY